MKKVFFTFLAIFTMIACEGPMGPQGEPGYGTNWYTATFTVSKSDWILAGEPGSLNSYFYADKNIPELTDFVFKEGVVIGYIETAKSVKNGLPFVLHMGEADGGKEFLWTQTYDFDYSPGGIRFFLTYSDFNTQMAPAGETFHIVLMW